MASATAGDFIEVTTRFTIDGGPELEESLAWICARVGQEVGSKIPRQDLDAIVLGGGYGRGEGGVLQTESGEKPYNDLEFYIFLRGNRLWMEHRYASALHELAERLSRAAGLHIEFKIDSASRWRRGPVSMFSYDLLSGHHTVAGDESVFHGCDHHLDAPAIPLSEASRLMFNRCSGLLLSSELLQNAPLTHQSADFISRNLAKIQLALGDAVLTASRQYHWSARERNLRLAALPPEDFPNWLPAVQADHHAGLAFKLHPRLAFKSHDALRAEHQRLKASALQLWLWLEGRRLEQRFASASDYALSDVDKCPGTSSLRNYFLSLRTFGPKATLAAVSMRYPRERLFNALALLLWHAEEVAHPRFLTRLQHQLQTDAPDWPGLVGAFKRIWPGYG